jgi:uncharacterized protein (TIGR03000 family)
MAYKDLLIPAALCVSLLFSANEAQAQKGGHGGGHSGGGGAHMSSGHGGSAYHGGSYHNGAYYHNGNYHYGYGYPFIGIGLGYYGGGYGYGYSYPYYSDYAAPRVAYYPAPIVVDRQLPLDAQAMVTSAAQVRVLVPDGQAKVWFDGTLTKQEGTDRLYHTPALSGSGPFTYKVRAAWMANGKEVALESAAQVTPGQTTTIDFTRMPSEPIPLPMPKKD